MWALLLVLLLLPPGRFQQIAGQLSLKVNSGWSCDWDVKPNRIAGSVELCD